MALASPNPTAAKSTTSPTSTATTLVCLSTSGSSHPHPRPQLTTKPPRHRGTKACRRCRRLRNKCIHDQGQTPCQGCVSAGPDTAASCAFPVRGERDVDREFRRRPRPQQRLPPAQSQWPRLPGQPLRRLPPPGSDGGCWPPHDEIVDGCRTFVTCYFQLGFLPRSLFLERLVQQGPDASDDSDNGCSSRFLLSCLLSISSRFTPRLVQRYGSRTAATDHFLGLAQSQALTEMYAPSLERTQAFFILSIAEWGNSDRDRSAIDMAVALRMALLLRLHKEETYASMESATPSALAAATSQPQRTTTTTTATLMPTAEATPRTTDRVTPIMNSSSAATPRLRSVPSHTTSLGTSTATADHVVRLESARRTLWMIYSQENLHSGTSTPAPLSLEDTTALLPCNEADFSFGTVPFFRAALEGTPPADENPALAVHPDRCLFATLIQAHSLWGRVARHATRWSLGNGRYGGGRPGSTYTAITDALRRWEATLPARHRWSLWNLRGWRSEGLHLAYLSVVMVLRLSNIVIRRVYLDEMIAALGPHSPPSDVTTTSPIPAPLRPPASSPSATTAAWQRISYELFDNVVELHEQVTAYFQMRTPDEGFPAILVFCVYMCGSLASSLWHNPYLCPHVSPQEAEEMALGTLRILGELYTAWPASARWEEVLRRVTGPSSDVASNAATHVASDDPTMAVEAEAVPVPVSAPPTHADMTVMAIDAPEQPLPWTLDLPVPPVGDSDTVVSRSSTTVSDQDDPRPLIIDDFPSDLFNAELADYLNGTIHYGLLDGLY